MSLRKTCISEKGDASDRGLGRRLERLVVQARDLVGLQRGHRERPPVVTAELDLVDARSGALYYRADLAAYQALLRQVLEQCYHRKYLNFGHGELSSYGT